MKTLVSLFIYFCIGTAVFSQGGTEFVVHNNDSNINTISFKVYPVSMVFNHIPPVSSEKTQYNLLAGRDRPSINSYINGRSINDTFWTIFPGQWKAFEFDRASQPSTSAVGTLGYGRYRFEFWFASNTNGTSDDFVDVEFDYNHGYFTAGGSTDLTIELKEDSMFIPRIFYRWYCMPEPTVSVPINRLLKGWEQVYPNYWREKDPGNFKYNSGDYNGSEFHPNNYDIIPQDPRRDCVNEVYSQYPYQNHLFNYAYTDPLNNIDYYGPSNIGVLTLRLTIEKDISTPNFLSRFYGTYPCVLPSPIVITDGASLIVYKGSNDEERNFVFKNIELTYWGTNLKIESGGTMELQISDTATERAHVKFESYCNTEIEHNGTLKLKTNSQWELTGNSQMIWYPNSVIVFIGNTLVPNNYGRIILRDSSVLTDCGANIIGPLTLTQNPGTTYRVVNDCSLPLGGGPFESLVDSGGSITVNSGAVLEVGGGGKLIFDGAESHLKLELGSYVKLGSGASIEFRNGAYLDANGCTFTSLNGSEIWEGVILDGAGSLTNIQNCTFNNAATSISVTNTVCNISGNTFNINSNSSCLYGINAVNESNITITGNTFNANSNSAAECIRFFNYDGDGIPGGGGSAYALNIYDNEFYGSLNAIDITCLTASQLPFYIAYNQFYPSSGVTSNGIFAYNISSNIKNNVFNNSNSYKSVTLQFSTVNLYNNALNSVNQNIWSSNSTLMQMAPVQNELGQWVWYGGYNRLTSGSLYNMEFRSYSNPTISPNGLNCFTVTTQPNFLGELCLGSKPYKAYDNYWSPTVSGTTFDITCNNNPVNVTYTANLTECPYIDPNSVTGSYVTALGNSIYDTVFVTSGGEGGSYPGTEKTIKKSSNTVDLLYFEAIQKRKQRDYAGAINKCKDLLNNHDTSSYFNSALTELYLNYLESDTTGNQVITNGLFNNLKTYIEQKMQQYQNNAQFVERAYKYVLMCLVKIKNYSEGIAGYENITNNHPDPIVRLNASWDRSAVVFMMGQGSAENDFTINSTKSRNKKLLDKNPAHKIAEKIFKEQKEVSKREEKNSELYNDDAVKMNTVKYTKEEKAIIERRIENYNPPDKKDFMDKLSNDIKLIEQINTAKTTKKITSNVPKTYKLYQNFPNPFNPTTTIKYETPKDAEVTIKVYDLLGREVFSINEYKKAGSYEVKFDGRNLASGLYIYKISAGSFEDSKKMVLIK